MRQYAPGHFKAPAMKPSVACLLSFSHFLAPGILAENGPVQSGPAVVVQSCCSILREHRVSGLPDVEAFKKLAPLISPELAASLKAAQKEQEDFIRENPDEKPPWIEGDLFSSLFEGAQTFQLGQTRISGDLAEVPVTCTYAEGGHSTVWTDTWILVNTADGWRLDDVSYGGTWDFSNTGSLKAALRPLPGGDPAVRKKDWLPAPGTLVLPVQGSVSPNGLYAIGWGYEKGPVDWSKLAYQEQANSGWGEVTFSTKLAKEPLDAALADDANFLLDLHSGKALCKLGIYYPGERPSFNHDSLVAVWSPRSACVMVIVTAKWESEFAHIAWIEDGACAGSIDVFEPLREVARQAALNRKHPAAKRLREENDYGYSIDEVRLRDDGSFTATVSGKVPKLDEDSACIEVEIEGRFQRAQEGQGVVVEVRRSKLRP